MLEYASSIYFNATIFRFRLLRAPSFTGAKVHVTHFPKIHIRRPPLLRMAQSGHFALGIYAIPQGAAYTACALQASTMHDAYWSPSVHALLEIFAD